MTRKELKYYLRMYPLISKAIRQNLHSADVIIYGRKKRIAIPDWLYKINDIFAVISSPGENALLSEILELAYKSGEEDKRVIALLPVTESGYYRLKRQIEELSHESTTESENKENED